LNHQLKKQLNAKKYYYYVAAYLNAKGYKYLNCVLKMMQRIYDKNNNFGIDMDITFKGERVLNKYYKFVNEEKKIIEGNLSQNDRNRMFSDNSRIFIYEKLIVKKNQDLLVE
jgi:ribose 5-phosphate isomerase RpiB